jgi:micrococcal nuclease
MPVGIAAYAYHLELIDQFESLAMRLLRRLLRAFSRSRRPKAVVIRQETTVEEDLRPWAPRVVVQQKTEIRIVEVRELRGRAWVIDGDTIDIAGTRIRLSGIDAPEMDHPYGKSAKWALVNQCKGQDVRAVFDGDLSHDRTVATCYLPDGRDLSAEMVKAGMAIDWPKFSRGKYSSLELPGIRKKLWRCDARQKGRFPPSLPD